MLGLSLHQVHKAYSVAVLRLQRVVNDEVGGAEVVIIGPSPWMDVRVYSRQGPNLYPPDRTSVASGLPQFVVEERERLGALRYFPEHSAVTSDYSGGLPRRADSLQRYETDGALRSVR